MRQLEKTATDIWGEKRRFLANPGQPELRTHTHKKNRKGISLSGPRFPLVFP